MKKGVDYYTTMTTERGTSLLIILYIHNYNYYIDVVIGKPTNIEIFNHWVLHCVVAIMYSIYH